MANPTWYAAVAEQFTHFRTLQFQGGEVANPVGQYLDSWITQLVIEYDINSRFALRLSVPIIEHQFRRPGGFGIDERNVSGMGDMSILLKTVVFK
jgi:hypothetical protein